VEHFERVASINLQRATIRGWTLKRDVGPGVAGIAYTGVVRAVGGTRLRRDIHVLGFNHNIQSSFGVTTQVTEAIRDWIADAAAESVA